MLSAAWDAAVFFIGLDLPAVAIFDFEKMSPARKNDMERLCERYDIDVIYLIHSRLN